MLRNAIAHATYKVERQGKIVRFWRKGKLTRSLSFSQVHDLYTDSLYYQQGFTKAVRDFAYGIHPECPYVWHLGPRY